MEVASFISLMDQQLEQRNEKQTLVKKLKSVEFYRAGDNSFRVEVSHVNGYMQVYLVRYWKPKDKVEWFPTRRQIGIPIAAWKNLKNAIALVDDTIGRLNISTSID